MGCDSSDSSSGQGDLRVDHVGQGSPEARRMSGAPAGDLPGVSVGSLLLQDFTQQVIKPRPGAPRDQAPPPPLLYTRLPSPYPPNRRLVGILDDERPPNSTGLISPGQGYFGNPSGSTLGMVNAIQNIGVLMALPMAPYVSDKFGRKKSLVTGALIMLGGVTLQAASTNIWHFVGSRGMSKWFYRLWLTGCVSKSAYSRARPGIRDKRCASAHHRVKIFDSGLGLLRNFPNVWDNLVMENPIAPTRSAFTDSSMPPVNRDAEAIEILGKYHANGNTSDPLVVLEYQEIREALILEKEISGEVSYFTLFKSVGNLKRMRIIIALGFFSQWSGNGLFSYYINEIFKACHTLGITSPGMKTLINAILQCSYVRRPCGSADHVCKYCAQHGYHGLNFRDSLGRFECGNAMCILRMDDYSSTISTSWQYCRSKRSRTLEYVNPIALGAIGWKYALVYCGWLLFEFVFVFRYIIETKGRSLEQTAALFDGEGHADALEQGEIRAALDSRPQLTGVVKLAMMPLAILKSEPVTMNTTTTSPSTLIEMMIRSMRCDGLIHIIQNPGDLASTRLKGRYTLIIVVIDTSFSLKFLFGPSYLGM
ncbi:hexose transporter [Rhizoctonia solani AG-1 IA]|uniref:Hexose transporter n=1 Tax=Thanatephorus cucumeris (strain AG1-IA) TaxID=983506 RepID=L8WV97_THACA|nr:hexose transporter [Rhizoctonia solani AG-1 IA]